MDSDQFNAPPTTSAALYAYFERFGATAAATDIELVHFQGESDIECWFSAWQAEGLPLAKQALREGLEPVLGLSFYTWNAAEFLALTRRIKAIIPDILIVAGGPHVQQAKDYLGIDPIDLIVLGEGEETFQELLDCNDRSQWSHIAGLAYLDNNEILQTPERPRCTDLERFPSPLDVLNLLGEDGKPRYESISYETSRGCPFKCAFCEWGTGAIGSKMYQWPMSRIESDWERITDAGIQNIWLADSNFGALKQDLDKARLIVDLKQRKGLPLSFATSWSKKHSRQVQEIALLLHKNSLLPHYQLALQTLTPEALRLSNRQNMSSNQYEPIAKHMSQQGVPIAAELIWGLPGDNLPDFEANLDKLLATFPNINIFGYTLLPGTEFYRKRDEYRIEAIPVAGYGKAKGEYVVGCHSFTRSQGEEGYFLISAHILLVHGHIMPLTTRALALMGKVAVSPLLREAMRGIVERFLDKVPGLNPLDTMEIYERRNEIYLAALDDLDLLYATLRNAVISAHDKKNIDVQPILDTLSLDQAMCPRVGAESVMHFDFSFNAHELYQSLSAMELPDNLNKDRVNSQLTVRHPGGVGDILHDADGGSWLRGMIIEETEPLAAQAVGAQAIAIA